MTCPACSRRTLTALLRDTITLRTSIPSPARSYATVNTRRKKTAAPSDDFWIPFEPIPLAAPVHSQARPSSIDPAPALSTPQARNTTSETEPWIARGSQARSPPEEDSMVLSTVVKGFSLETIQKTVEKDFFFDTSSLRESGRGWNIFDSLLPKISGAIVPAAKRSGDPGEKKFKPRTPLAAIAYHERKAKTAAAAPPSSDSKERWATKPGRMLRVERRRAQFGEARPDGEQAAPKAKAATSARPAKPAKPQTTTTSSSALQTPAPSTIPTTSATPTNSSTAKAATSNLGPKRLSPDAMEGVRTLAAQYPDHFTPKVLAQHFVVPEYTIERILRSKWRPNPEEQEERRERWERRGKKIWESLVEQGVHPPKRWREQGIGGGPRRGPEEKKREWKEKRAASGGKDGFEDGWAEVDGMQDGVGGVKKRTGGIVVREGVVASRAS